MKLSLKTSTGGKISIHFGAEVTTNLWDGSWYVITDKVVIEKLRQVEKSSDPDALATKIMKDYSIEDIGRPYRRERKPEESIEPIMPTPSSEPTIEPATDPGAPPFLELDRIEVSKLIMNFFSEFTFKPAARFLNTLSHKSTTLDAARNYVIGYMSLCNHPDLNGIREKTKSEEFKDIVKRLAKVKSDKIINNRFEIFYGDPGTGKTTEAVNAHPKAEVTICNSSMLPDDLMRVFDFNDENGNPVFKPSALQNAMINDTDTILDEINLLNFDCLRFVQGLTDGKSEINYNGKTIKIGPNFKIIGTMNLEVNGQIYNLPDPLVDRAFNIKKFELTPDKLAEYSF